MMKRLLVQGSLVCLATASLFAGAQAASAAGTTRYVAPGGSDTANNCASKTSPCQHVQHAVDVALAGDTVLLAAGTYAEQVTIGKSLTLQGAGVDQSVIKAPSAMVVDAELNFNIVEINNAATVHAIRLTVAGPGPSGCNSISSGIAVIGGAALEIGKPIGPPP